MDSDDGGRVGEPSWWRRFRPKDERGRWFAVAGAVAVVWALGLAVAATGSNSSPKTNAAAPAERRHVAVKADRRTTTTTSAATTSTTAVEEQPAVTLVQATSAATAGSINGVRAEPDAALTPGALNPDVTQATIDSTICVSGYTTTIRPPTSYTNRVKTAQLAAYEYSQPAYQFELDHLVSLELGGAPYAVENLWPEPWEKSGLVPDGWGAETKDSFENYLHRAVCAHRVTLADAQQQIAADWISNAVAVGIAAGAPPTTTSTVPVVGTTTTVAPTTTTAASSGVPAGASAQCVDGTYSNSQHRSGTCSHHGGVARWINPPSS